MPPDLEEQGEHREQGMPLMKHEEENQGGSKAPRRQIWRRKGSTRSRVHSQCRRRGITGRSRRSGRVSGLITGRAPWPRGLEQWPFADVGGADVVVAAPISRVEQMPQISCWSEKWRPVWRKPLQVQIKFQSDKFIGEAHFQNAAAHSLRVGGLMISVCSIVSRAMVD
jgi:hypothetical protein